VFGRGTATDVDLLKYLQGEEKGKVSRIHAVLELSQRSEAEMGWFIECWGRNRVSVDRVSYSGIENDLVTWVPIKSGSILEIRQTTFQIEILDQQVTNPLERQVTVPDRLNH
jgi:hypothetical protein